MKEAGRKKGYKGEKREGKERNLTEENRVGVFLFLVLPRMDKFLAKDY